MTGGSRRILRALTLDGRVFREIVDDPSSTRPAMGIVALVALAHGAGGMLRSIPTDDALWTAGLYGLVAEVAFFVGAVLGIAALLRFVGSGAVPRAGVVRALGFATLPGALILPAAVVSLVGVGIEFPVLLATLVWRLAAGGVAVHALSRGGIGKAAVVFAIGVACGAAAVVGATTMLSAMLR